MAVREAEAVAEQVRRHAAIAALRSRLERARTSEARLLAIESQRAGNAMDDAPLQRLTVLDDARVKAEARLHAGAARLTLRAERDLTLSVGGEDTVVVAGAALERTASDQLDLRIDGVLSLSIHGRGDSGRLARTTAQAQRDLAEVGAESVAQARQRRTERITLESERGQVREALDGALGGDTSTLLAAQIDNLHAQVEAFHEAHRTNMAADPAPVPDETLAHEAVPAARKAWDEARAKAERHRTELDALEREGARLETQVELLEAQALEAGSEAADLANALAEARAQVDDAALTTRATQAAVHLTSGQEAYRRAEEDLLALDPERVEPILKSAAARRERLQAEIASLTAQPNEDQGYLKARGAGGEGVSEHLAVATMIAERAGRAHASSEARAQASDFLYATLKRHREAALRAYREPYRLEVERLGRLVFGPDFAVELADDLRIEKRRLDGISLGAEQLSTGAQEQLAVVARLACARLVSGEGAPVVLDDAFSYSDPERLAGICLALDGAGEAGQIVLLTCTPERYRAWGARRWSGSRDRCSRISAPGRPRPMACRRSPP